MNEHQFNRQYIEDDSIPGLPAIVCKIKCSKCSLERFTAIAKRSMGSAKTMNSVEAQMELAVQGIDCVGDI